MGDYIETKNIKAYVQENGIIRLDNGKKKGYFLGRLIDGITYDQLENIDIVKESVQTLTKAIRENEDLMMGYKANIAMAFVDELNETKEFKTIPYNVIHKFANKAADRFLENWCREV